MRAPSTPAAAAPAASRVKSATSVATWSLRDRAVCSLPADRPGELGDAAARPPCGCPRRPGATRSSLGELRLDLVERREQRVAVGLGDDARRRPACARGRATGRRRAARAAGRSERGVERLEDRVLGLGEAAHGAASVVAARARLAIGGSARLQGDARAAIGVTTVGCAASPPARRAGGTSRPGDRLGTSSRRLVADLRSRGLSALWPAVGGGTAAEASSGAPSPPRGARRRLQRRLDAPSRLYCGWSACTQRSPARRRDRLPRRTGVELEAARWRTLPP